MAMDTIAMEAPVMITMAVIVVEIVVTEAMTTPDHHPVDMAMVNTIVVLISKPPLLIHHTINKTIAITIITKLNIKKYF